MAAGPVCDMEGTSHLTEEQATGVEALIAGIQGRTYTDFVKLLESREVEHMREFETIRSRILSVKESSAHRLLVLRTAGGELVAGDGIRLAKGPQLYDSFRE